MPQGHQTKHIMVNEARRLFSFFLCWASKEVARSAAVVWRTKCAAKPRARCFQHSLLPRSCCILSCWLRRTFQNSSSRVVAQILTQWVFQSGICVLCPNLQLSGIDATAGSCGQGPQATRGDFCRICVLLVHQLHLFQDEFSIVSRNILGGYHAKRMLHAFTCLRWIQNEVSQVPGVTVCHHGVRSLVIWRQSIKNTVRHQTHISTFTLLLMAFRGRFQKHQGLTTVDPSALPSADGPCARVRSAVSHRVQSSSSTRQTQIGCFQLENTERVGVKITETTRHKSILWNRQSIQSRQNVQDGCCRQNFQVLLHRLYHHQPQVFCRCLRLHLLSGTCVLDGGQNFHWTQQWPWQNSTIMLAAKFRERIFLFPNVAQLARSTLANADLHCSWKVSDTSGPKQPIFKGDRFGWWRHMHMIQLKHTLVHIHSIIFLVLTQKGTTRQQTSRVAIVCGCLNLVATRLWATALQSSTHYLLPLPHAANPHACKQQSQNEILAKMAPQ